MHFGIPAQADERTTSNSWGFKTCFLSTLEQRRELEEGCEYVWMTWRDQVKESGWEGRAPGVRVHVLPCQEQVAPHLVLEERPSPWACWYLACWQAVWSWPLTEGCFGDNISPNIVTVPVACDRYHYKTLIACYLFFFSFLSVYSTLLPSWVIHYHAELSVTFFGRHYHDTPLTRGWQALSSHSCSWKHGAFFFPLKSLVTLHGVVFTEVGCHIFLLLVLLLTANTQLYIVYICNECFYVLWNV